MKLLKKTYLSAVLAILISFSTFIPSSFADPIKKDQQFFDAVREYVLDNYALEITEEQLYDAAIKGMFDALDPYSVYLTKDQYTSFSDEATGSFAGIGAVIGKQEDGFYIIEVMKDSPAKSAGLKAMDKLIYLNDKQIDQKLQIEDIINTIKGPAGSIVKLKVQRMETALDIKDKNTAPVKKILDFTLTRKIITVNPIESYVLKKDIGYLRIREFNDNTYSSISEAIKDLKKKGASKLVLDLRGNPGGSLLEVIKTANYFVPAGKMVEIRYKSGESDVFDSNGSLQFKKVAVLVDGSTASAAEILAGAIQDTKSGILIGQKTFGKGVVQDVYSLINGEAIKLTIAKYILPSGRDINMVGIQPDISLQYKLLDKPDGNITDNQIQKAVELFQ